MFELHPQLAKDTFPIGESRLCQLLLMNNQLFPWVILVPMVEHATEIVDLPSEQQKWLMEDISRASLLMQKTFSPHKLNVAALGNQVPMLHVHVIARYQHDSAWPNPVWGAGCIPYQAPEAIIVSLRKEWAGLSS